MAHTVESLSLLLKKELFSWEKNGSTADWELPPSIQGVFVDHLLATGYPDYAAILHRMQIYVTKDKNAFACISYDGTVMKLSRFLFIHSVNGAFELRPDWPDVMSIIIRHEILHRLLRHNTREQLFESACSGKIDRGTLAVAKDIEVSNYYSLDDVDTWNSNPDVFYGAYCVYPEYETTTKAQRLEFCGMPYERIYEKLLEENQQENPQEQNNPDQNNQGSYSGLLGLSNQGMPNPPKNPSDMDVDSSVGGQSGDSNSSENKSDDLDKNQSDKVDENQFDDLGENQPDKSNENQLDDSDANNSDNKQPEQQDIPEQENESDSLPISDHTREQILKEVESRNVKDTEDRQVQGGPGGYSPTSNTYVSREDYSADVLKSTLQYDLGMFFGNVSKFVRHSTFARPNKKYADSDIIHKSRLMLPREQGELALYIDRSGSFCTAKTIAAESIFQKLKLMKNMSLKVFYFADKVVTEADYNGVGKKKPVSPGGGTSYENVFKHIKENKHTNVAIISDLDSIGRFSDGRAYLADVKSLWYCCVRNASLYHNIEEQIHKDEMVGVINYAPPCLSYFVVHAKPQTRISVWNVNVVTVMHKEKAGGWYNQSIKSNVMKVGTTTCGRYETDLAHKLTENVYVDVSAMPEVESERRTYN